MPAQAEFVVPGWLDWWWDLMVPLTGSLTWSAWAAVFSLLALLNTARLADRQHHRERSKDAVFVWAAGRALQEAVATFETLIASAKDGCLSLSRCRLCLDFFEDHKFDDALDKFSPEKFPTLLSLNDFRRALIEFKKLRLELDQAQRTGQSPSLAEIEMFVKEINSRARSLKDQARGLVSKNEWARINGKVPPYSFAMVLSLITASRARLGSI